MSIRIAVASAAATGTKRGSSRAASMVALATPSRRRRCVSRLPMQPRSSPLSVRVTKTAPRPPPSRQVRIARSSRCGSARRVAAASATRARARSACRASAPTTGARAELTGASWSPDWSICRMALDGVCCLVALSTEMVALARRGRPVLDRLMQRPSGPAADRRSGRHSSLEAWMHDATESRPVAVPTILATPLPDGSVRCGVCAHRCLVRPGRRGICGVRENRDGELISLAYGAVVAVGVDPIEKKPLFHVAPGSTAYSIATPGCPFHCTFCQNWEIAQGPRLGIALPTRRLPADGGGRGGAGPRSRIGRVHVRRADDLPRVRSRHRPVRPGCRPAQPVHHRRLCHAGGDRPARPGPRRGERRPEVVRRRVLPQGVRRAAGAGPRLDRRDAPGGDLARADDADHPRPQRRRSPSSGP